jgi:hypothetical protein
MRNDMRNDLLAMITGRPDRFPINRKLLPLQ